MIRLALLLLLVVQGGTAPQPGVSGIVIDAGALLLQPLFNARLELDTSPRMVVRSDENGAFVFPNLKPGNYRLTVSRDGFLRRTISVRVSATESTPLRIALDIAPTFFGRIRDIRNQPVPDVLVEAIRVVYGPRGQRSLVTAESALSDDRGEYHLYWLDPGEYYIRAAGNFFPGTQDPTEAGLLRLHMGMTVNVPDLRVQARTPVALAGHISIESTGEGAATTIHVVPAGAAASTQKFDGQSIGVGKNKGDFTIGGLMPGTYIVSAQDTEYGQALTVHRKVNLKTTERAMSLLLVPGVTAKGQILAEDGRAVDLRSARVVLDSIDPDLPTPQAAAVDRNGQFTASRIEPGDYAIRILDLPEDRYVKAAISGEVDIRANPLRIDYASPPPIQLVLGLDGGRLDGVAVDYRDRPFSDATVVLIPDRARRNFSDEYRAATSAADGQFTLRGIPPGDYKLFAWQNIEANAWMNPNYLEGYEPLGAPVHIEASSKATTAVRLIPSD